MATIRIDITADDDRALSNLRKFIKTSEGDFDRFGKNVSKSTGRIDAGLKRLGATFLTVFGGRALARGFTQTIDSLDRVGKLSLRLGETTEFLSEMAFVADRSGVAFNTLAVGIQRANRRIAEVAVTGKGVALETFQALDIETRNVSGRIKTFEEILPDLVRGFEGVSDEGEKVRLAFKLLDTEGVGFLQVIKQGADDIEALRERARELGISFDKDMTKKAEDAKDSITDMNAALKGLTTEISIGAAPAVASLAEKLTIFFNTVRQGRNFNLKFGPDFLSVEEPEQIPVERNLLLEFQGRMQEELISKREQALSEERIRIQAIAAQEIERLRQNLRLSNLLDLHGEKAEAVRGKVLETARLEGIRIIAQQDLNKLKEKELEFVQQETIANAKIEIQETKLNELEQERLKQMRLQNEAAQFAKDSFEDIALSLANAADSGRSLASSAVDIAKNLAIRGGIKLLSFGLFGQRGLDFTVPPGFPNDSFRVPLNVSSGERVKVIPKEQISNDQRVTIGTLQVLVQDSASFDIDDIIKQVNKRAELGTVVKSNKMIT